MTAKQKSQDMNLLLKKQKVEEEKHLKELSKMKAENTALKAQTQKTKDPLTPATTFKVDNDTIKQWIEQNVERMIIVKNLNKDLQSHMNQQNLILKEIEEE